MFKRDGIRYNPVNATTLEVSSDFHIESIIEDYKITKLQIKDKEIKLQDTFAFNKDDKKFNYAVNHIMSVGKNKFLLKTELKNKASVYILPALKRLCIQDVRKKFNQSTLKEISKYCFNTYFINSYIDGNCADSVTGFLYLKFMFSSHPTYQNMEYLITTIHPYYYKLLYSRDIYTYIKFKLPNKYTEDLKNFIKGKYSLLSKELKRDIITFHGVSKKSNLYQILYDKDNPDCSYRKQLETELDTDLQGAELDDIPDKETNLIIL